MRVAIVYSKLDPVGVAVSKMIAGEGFRRSDCALAVECFESGEGVKLAGYNVDQVLFEFLDASPDPGADAVIVLSRHESSSKVRSLTVHFTGNPGPEAPFGGRPSELSYAPADLGLSLLRHYREAAEDRGIVDRYEVTYEATHHGPTSNSKPVVFIEIGSSPEEWGDPTAQAAMAEAVLASVRDPPPPCAPTVGLGSTHYPAKFTAEALERGTCFGHMLSKHSLKAMSQGVLRQAVEKSLPGGAREAAVEKKGVGSELRSRILDELRSLGVAVRMV